MIQMTPTLRALEKRLNGQALEQLRLIVAQQAETIEQLENSLYIAENNAQFYQDNWHELEDQITANGGLLGLTKSGKTVLVDGESC